LHSSLFAALSTPDEPISPSQTVLLKILDSHVSSTTRPNPIPSPNEFLIPLFLSLAHYAKSSMRSGQDDARLPKVFEGLVLVCEGLSGIGLAVQGRLDRREAEEGGDELMLNIMKRDVVKPLIGKSFFGFPLPLVF